MDPNGDFARSLSLLRREKGISQRTACRELGISQALLSHYENGVREPGLAFVRRACDYYHVSADFLLGRTLSREGKMIGADELYDLSAERSHVLQGSIAATLYKKLLVNSVGMLFVLLDHTGSKKAIQAAANYLSSAIYQLFRHLFRLAGTQDEKFFALTPDHFLVGSTHADMIYSEADYVDALNEQRKEYGKEAFPAMDNDTLASEYPGLYQSMFQILHSTSERINYNLENRWADNK